MSRLRVVPIVEGHGEYECIRKLVERVWLELLGQEHVEVLRPIREKRGRLVKPQQLAKAVELAAAKLGNSPSDDPALILLLIDADKDPPCVLGPRLLDDARVARADMEIACVVANVEYETWFVAAAESLPEYLALPGAAPADPEGQRLGKGWIERHFQGMGARYSETQDQPAMTARMDLVLCRRRSPSFDKFCREFEKRRPQADELSPQADR